MVHNNIALLSKQIDELRDLLTLLNDTFDIIGDTETRLREDDPLVNIDIDGYIFKPFLGMLFDINHGKIVTSNYRKPTFTGVYTHFHSCICLVWLLSTILVLYFSTSLLCNYHIGENCREKWQSFGAVTTLLSINNFPPRIIFPTKRKKI